MRSLFLAFADSYFSNPWTRRATHLVHSLPYFAAAYAFGWVGCFERCDRQ